MNNLGLKSHQHHDQADLHQRLRERATCLCRQEVGYAKEDEELPRLPHRFQKRFPLSLCLRQRPVLIGASCQEVNVIHHQH